MVKQRLQMMERRLFNIIATPAGLLTIISGFAMVAYNPEYFFKQGWFHTKLLAVFFLILMHLWSIGLRSTLAKRDHPYPAGWLRLLNEVPTLLMIGIVLLVVLKPF